MAATAQAFRPLEALALARWELAERTKTRRLTEQADAIRARCRQSFANFVREAWHVLEPRTPLVWNWHLDAICEHLGAVTSGRINRLVINVPPGSSKSLIVSVLWPAWEWGPMGLLSMRYLATSYSDKLVSRDTRKCRDLILSPWFQKLWPAVKLVRRGEVSFANDNTGSREGIPFGSLTSQRGDRLIIDDPHSTETAESDIEREKTSRKFREGALDRLNDLHASAIVVIMQRLHEGDVTGVIDKMPELGFVHLVIAMRYDRKLARKYCPNKLGWVDPRTVDDELMDPVRFTRADLDKLEIGKGAYAWAGQYQQQPAPRGGGLFKDDWWRYYRKEALPPVRRIVQSWDTAFKDKTKNDPSSCTTWAECENGYYLLHRQNARMQYPLLKQIAISLGRRTWAGMVPVAILIEDKASGQSLIQDLRLTNLPIIPINPGTLDKYNRAVAVTGIVESGRVFLPEGEPWVADYLHQLGAFPTAAHDDDVDSTTQALSYMHLNAGRSGFIDFIRQELAENGIAIDDEDDDDDL